MKRDAASDAELIELERKTRAQFTEQSDPYYRDRPPCGTTASSSRRRPRDILGLVLALAAAETAQDRPLSPSTACNRRI